MGKVVISTIALKFIEKGGSSFFKLEPLVSREDIPDWLLKSKEFSEAKEKGFVKLLGTEDKGSQGLDRELTKLAVKLDVPFDSNTDQAKLEGLVKAAQAEYDGLVEKLKAADVPVQPNTKMATLRTKVEELPKD